MEPPMSMYSNLTREETLKLIAQKRKEIEGKHPDLRYVRIKEANLQILYAHLQRLHTK
mgnify:CR=1 FL=1